MEGTGLSALLRYLELFPIGFSGCFFKSVKSSDKWRSGQQRESVTVTGHCWTRSPLIKECVRVLMWFCVWDLLLSKSVDIWPQSWPSDPSLTPQFGSHCRAEGLIGSSCWLMVLLSSLGRKPRPVSVHNRAEPCESTGAAPHGHRAQKLCVWSLWGHVTQLTFILSVRTLDLIPQHSAHAMWQITLSCGVSASGKIISYYSC